MSRKSGPVPVKNQPLQPPQPGATRPHLPHERDQSSDSQGAPVQDIIKQAHDDIVSGQKDTDLRGSPGQDKPTK